MTGGSLFVLAAVQLLLTAAPGVASALFAARLGVRRVPVLIGIGLAGSGAGALLAFWVYYLAPGLGAYCAYLLFFGSIALAVWSWPALRAERGLLRELSVPLALWALGSLFIVFFGFLHGGTELALETGGARFSAHPSQMASDNFIPWFFANWVFEGSPGSAPIFEPGWHFSDRPPLQVGYILSQRTFGWDPGSLHAELIGIVTQQLWIFGLWAVLAAVRAPGRTRALVMIAALVSDVAIVHSFYVWPKLLAASFALAGLALVLDRDGQGLRREPWTMVLFGVLFALSYLSHGSTVFVLLPVLALALLRGLPSWRWLAAAVAAALVLVLPWSAFQRYEDPPGNRVVKWSLAGVVEIDDRGTTEAVADAYREAGVGGSLENKLHNFWTMVGGGPVGDSEDLGWFSNAFDDSADAVSEAAGGHFGEAASEVRQSRFTHLLWTFGLLILALPAIAVGALRGRVRAGPDWQLARVCAFVVALGAVVWGLVMFGNPPAQAIVHVGSLALPLLGVAGLIGGLRATCPRWAEWLVGANVATVLLIYLQPLQPLPGTSYEAFNAVAAVACLVGFALVALGARTQQPSITSPS
ncbi:MAG TPA: hypothetical protein VF081_10730 [Solirubrobacterales bacterium]